MLTDLRAFVRESNAIEGIRREPTQEEVCAHDWFLTLPHITIENLEGFVAVIQPDAELRHAPGLNVRVGEHIAPAGGPEIPEKLRVILSAANAGANPWAVHCDYEDLHPFTDGNGRSGRVLWLWQMNGDAPLGFLHTYYYQTLRNVRINEGA